MKKFFTRSVSFLLVAIIIFASYGTGTISCFALTQSDLNNDGIKVGCSILNGYSKFKIEKDKENFSNKVAIYCGLDVSNPYLLTLLGLFYLNKGIKFEKITEDNTYTMNLIDELNGFLKSMGIKNEKSQKFASENLKNFKVYEQYQTVGLYIVKCDSKQTLNFMKNKNVDFALADGVVPKNLKDLNLDGKTDEKDSKIIQSYLAENVNLVDNDKKNYYEYACDIDENKVIDITDVTTLQLNKNG